MVRRGNDKSNHYRVALSTVSLADFDFKHTVLQPQEINHLDKLQWKQLPSVPRKRTSCTVTQKRSVLLLPIEAGENQPSTTQAFSEKKISSLVRNKKRPKTHHSLSSPRLHLLHSMLTLAPWQASIRNRWVRSLLKRGNQKNRKNPSWEEIRAAIKAVIKY